MSIAITIKAIKLLKILDLDDFSLGCITKYLHKRDGTPSLEMFSTKYYKVFVGITREAEFSKQYLQAASLSPLL